VSAATIYYDTSVQHAIGGKQGSISREAPSMNSPSGKPFDTLDNSPQRTQTKNENAIERREQSEDPAKSPYGSTLKRRIRTSPRKQEVDVSKPELPRAAEAADSQAASPPQPAARATESAEGGLAADIERLEASLRWLKQQSGDLRGSHTNVLLPEWPNREIAGNSELNIGLARSLEPENLIPPALMRAQRGNVESALASRRVPLLILIAGLVAAPIVYFTVEKSSSAPEKVREARLVAVERQGVAPPPVAKPESEPQEATLEQQSIPLPPAATPQTEGRASKPSDPEPETSSDNKAPDVVSPPPIAVSPPPAGVSSRPAAASPPPAAATAGLQEGVLPKLPSASRTEDSAAPGAAAAPVRTLSRGDIELLMKQGEEFMAVGDVAQRVSCFGALPKQERPQLRWRWVPHLIRSSSRGWARWA
jgi:hypothetical protein